MEVELAGEICVGSGNGVGATDELAWIRTGRVKNTAENGPPNRGPNAVIRAGSARPMMYGAKRIAKYLLGTDIAGRQLAVRPDDTFIVSYPRSGNTWTRFLIANLLFGDQPVSFTNIERLIPDAEALSNRYLKGIPSPRVIKTHQYFDHRYPKVLYITRDPRDVLLSYYHFSRKYRHIADDYPLEQYIHGVVTGTLHSTAWGTWAENVGTWLAARNGRPTFLLLRYEDLLEDTQTDLAKVARFFGVDPNA